VVGYDNPFKAEEVHLKLWRMEKDYLIDLEDAAWAVKHKAGKHQAGVPSSQPVRNARPVQRELQ
ncbi:MAG: hypothetical protein L0099_16140, partial [Acidobacteria bacterium]|nr:hypothetical protein [Acidobacteriota bacterium]